MPTSTLEIFTSACACVGFEHDVLEANFAPCPIHSDREELAIEAIEP